MENIFYKVFPEKEQEHKNQNKRYINLKKKFLSIIKKKKFFPSIIEGKKVFFNNSRKKTFFLYKIDENNVIFKKKIKKEIKLLKFSNFSSKYIQDRKNFNSFFKNELKRFNVNKRIKIRFLKKLIFNRIRIKKRALKKEKLELQPFINELKIKIKFQLLIKDFFFLCKIFFKYTGSNMFATLTNNLGDVIFSYSAGIFRKLRTRKEKTTVLVAQQIGQLLSLRVYKTNARYICFIPYLNSRKMRPLIASTLFGFNFIRSVKISFIYIRRKVIRNGIRVRKIARK